MATRVSKNANVGPQKKNFCRICGNESKSVMVINGGKKKMVHVCHEGK